jgi:hypothetical protein
MKSTQTSVRQKNHFWTKKHPFECAANIDQKVFVMSNVDSLPLKGIDIFDPKTIGHHQF